METCGSKCFYKGGIYGYKDENGNFIALKILRKDKVIKKYYLTFNNSDGDCKITTSKPQEKDGYTIIEIKEEKTSMEIAKEWWAHLNIEERTSIMDNHREYFGKRESNLVFDHEIQAMYDIKRYIKR